MLEQVGLIAYPIAPCVFKGHILKNKPPLYLGFYVDDFIYFSEDPEVEKKLKKY